RAPWRPNHPRCRSRPRWRRTVRVSYRHAPVVTARPDIHLEHVTLNGPGGEIAEHGELLDGAERLGGAPGGARLRRVELPDEGELRGRWEANEVTGAAPAGGFPI